MIAKDVEASLGELIEGVETQRKDQPAPEVCQLSLVQADIDVDLLDGGPGHFEGTYGFLHRCRHLGLYGIRTEIGRKGDSPSLDTTIQAGGEVGLVECAKRVCGVWTGQSLHCKGRIGDIAGYRTLIDERRHTGEGIWSDHHGNATGGRLISIHAAPCRRYADRSTPVCAFGDRDEPVRNDCCRSTGGPPCITCGVEGVSRRTEQVVVTRAAKSHCRTVALTDDDGSSCLHTFCPRAVPVNGEIGHRRDASEGCGPSWLEVEQILHDDRDPMQRASHLISRDLGLGSPGCRHGFIEPTEHDGVETGLSLLDSLNGRLHHLDRR